MIITLLFDFNLPLSKSDVVMLKCIQTCPETTTKKNENRSTSSKGENQRLDIFIDAPPGGCRGMAANSKTF